MSETKALLEQVEEVDDSILEPVEPGSKKPTFSDPEWTQYVLNLLTEKEIVLAKDKKYPKMEGLRRVCRLIYGDIIVSNSLPTHAIYTNNGLITIASHHLVVDRYGDLGKKEVTAIGDAREEFLQRPYNQYVSANASTKAMGRAFRDMLELQVLVAEELNSVNDISAPDEPEDAGPADDAQKAAIKSVSKKLGIDVNKLLNMGPFSHKNIDSLKLGTARKIMSLLNGYQSGKDIPEEIEL